MGKIALYSLFIGCLNFPFYMLGTLIWLLFGVNILLTLSFFVFLICGILFSLDSVIIPRIRKQKVKPFVYTPIKNPKISVTMTAYNDEIPTPNAVKDFLSQENVAEVVVVDNNSTDRTSEVAREAGARAVIEKNQGYGYASIRALREGLKSDCDIIVLVESDRTFRGYDLKKMVDYLENADLVLGTRTTQEFLDQETQINWFTNWGNIFLAKLIQVRFKNKSRLTDAGFGFRAIKRDALVKIIDQLKVGGNHASVEFVMIALKNSLRVIEIPITFSKREGISKGAGKNNWAAFKIGLQMLWFILTFR